MGELLLLCLLFISPIWASELFYNVNGYWLAYTLVIVALYVLLFFSRFVMIQDGTFTLHRLFLKNVQIDLRRSSAKLAFGQHSVRIQDENQQVIYLFLSKKAIQTLKENSNGQNHEDHN